MINKRERGPIKLSTLAIIGVALIIAVTCFSLWMTSSISASKVIEKITLEKLEVSSKSVAKDVFLEAENVNFALDKYKDDVRLHELLKRSISEVNSNNQEIEELKSTLLSFFNEELELNSSLLSESLINKDGIVYLSTYGAEGNDYSKDKFFQDALSVDGVVISETRYIEEINTYANDVSMAIIEDGEFIGVITASIDSKAYEYIFDEYKKLGMEGFIVDSKGNFIYHEDSKYLGTSINDLGIDNLKSD